MANTYAPFGFRQFGHRDGSAPTMGQTKYLISSAQTFPIFTGDVVGISSAAPGIAPYIGSLGSTGAVTNYFEGIFLGCEYYNSNTNRVTFSSYWPGSGATGDITAFVCTDPEMTYIVQGTSGAVLGSTNIGWGISHSITLSSCGNTISGQSVMGVLSSQATLLSSATPWKIVDIYSNTAPPGVNGTSTGSEGAQIVIVAPVHGTRVTNIVGGNAIGVGISS